MSATQRDGVPHAFPFRFVERRETAPSGTFAIVASTGGGFFTRGGPMPLTLVAEALAQAILAVERPARSGSLRLVGLDRVALRRAVAVGDRLGVRVVQIGTLGSLRRYSCEAWRDGELAATAEVTVTV